LFSFLFNVAIKWTLLNTKKLEANSSVVTDTRLGRRTI